MLPSQYTSTYNSQFRNQNDHFISPHTGESMYHFPSQYDPSHYQRTPGHYTSKAEQAEQAMKSGAFSTGRTFSSTGAQITSNVNGSFVQGGSAYVNPVPVTGTTGCLPCQRGLVTSQQYTSNTVIPTTTGFTGGNACYPNQPLTARSGGVRESRSTVGTQNLPHLPFRSSYDSRDLWTVQTKPHTGTYEGLACAGSQSARYATSQGEEHHHDDHHHDHDHEPSQPGQPKKPCCQECKTGAAPCASTRTAQVAPFPGSTVTTSSFTSSYTTAEPWRYDTNGVAQTKNVELSVVTDPRNKYHIPGYAGFVRGRNFQHGETYAKTTRQCLDVAIDHPHDQGW